MCIVKSMNYKILENAISAARLETYLKLANDDKNQAIALYKKNIEISAKIFPIILQSEVFLRNGVDKKLIQYFDNREWWTLQNFLSLLTEKHLEILQSTKERNPSNIITKVPLSFWIIFFNREYDKTLWRNCLCEIFPAHSKRGTIRGKLRHLKGFRNRIAHCEHILGQYQKNYLYVFEIAEMLNHEFYHHMDWHKTKKTMVDPSGLEPET